MPSIPRLNAQKLSGDIELYAGDACSILGRLTPKSVQCIVTSPPYFGVRKYGGSEHEIGNQNLEAYLHELVRVSMYCKRVLRDDGVMFVVIGDGWMGSKDGGIVGVPWKMAFAFKEHGWILRQDLIWHKVNAIPDSVMDRFTKNHEYIFMFTKQRKYYLDVYATLTDTGSRKRSVWSVSRKKHPGFHEATFPEELIEPCILAGTSGGGCCSKCGAPLVRKVKKVGRIDPQRPIAIRDRSFKWSRQGIGGTLDGLPPKIETLGWGYTCDHAGAGRLPCTVLDPFIGSGTTAVVAKRNGRACIGVELYPEFITGIAEYRLAGVPIKKPRLGPVAEQT